MADDLTTQYGMYTYISQGPTFGGGNDFYLDSSMKYGGCNSHSYAGYGYSSSWLQQSTTGQSFTEVEVWYRLA